MLQFDWLKMFELDCPNKTSATVNLTLSLKRHNFYDRALKNNKSVREIVQILHGLCTILIEPYR
jgi:hypothetical protein